jgi:hypothetical protein
MTPCAFFPYPLAASEASGRAKNFLMNQPRMTRMTRMLTEHPTLDTRHPALLSVKSEVQQLN